MAQMLTVKQVAELRECSTQYIKRIIKEGKLPAESTLNSRRRMTYLIPLDALDADTQAKYLRSVREAAPGGMEEAPPEESAEGLDSFSAPEREEIGFWLDLIAEWQRFRGKAGSGNRAETDRKFVAWCSMEYPDRKISLDVLYRKWKAIRENDLRGLVDMRGKWRKGKSSIPEEIWQCFLYYYLDESQHPITRCIGFTRTWAQEYRPELFDEIPSYSAFSRKIKADLPEGVKVLGREGEKAFDDRCAPYIRRAYDDIRSNEWWIADNHTFDVMVRDEKGNTHRPYLTAFLDARSGIMVGRFITYAPSAEATLQALRKGIQDHGIPENIYVDNGREFLNYDVGGLGHRKKKPKDGVEKFEPPGVFKRLGIRMQNAIVRNAKAKIIERRFRDVKDHISRLFTTYTGGTVVEKPERLKHVLKKGDVLTEAEFQEHIDAIIDYYFNLEPYNGPVKEDRGKTKMQVYHDHLGTVRKASPGDLNLMLMRSSRKQKVGRRGVHLDINGTRIDYWNDDFILQLLGKEVYFRYDPENLGTIRVYDLEDRFLMEVPCADDTILSYNASKEEVKAGIAKTRRLKKIAKEYKENIMIAEAERVSALDMVMAKARKNKEAGVKYQDPKIVEIQRADETPAVRKVVGGVDLDTMINNAEKKRGK